MGKLIFITGGARSGKSRYAYELAAGRTDVAYIATAIPCDDEMRYRIARHRADRPVEWQTVEMYEDFGRLREDSDFASRGMVIIDCLTVLVGNQMGHDMDYDHMELSAVWEREREITDSVMELLDICLEQDKVTVVVANEVGLGVVPATKIGDLFRDIAGRVNQAVAARADEVYFTVAGIPKRWK